MKTIGIYFLAGLAALLGLKVLAALLAPVLAIAFGLIALAIPVALIIGLGYVVTRLFGGGRPQEI